MLTEANWLVVPNIFFCVSKKEVLWGLIACKWSKLNLNKPNFSKCNKYVLPFIGLWFKVNFHKVHMLISLLELFPWTEIGVLFIVSFKAVGFNLLDVTDLQI